MKRFSILSLVALLMATILLLSSCGMGASELKYTKLLESTATYEKAAAVTSANALSALKDLSVSASNGDLVYLTGTVGVSYDTRHVVYNLKTGSIVFDQTNSAANAANRVNYTVSLNDIGNYQEDKTYYFRVVTNLTSADVTTITTTLYDAAGASFASTSGSESTREMADLIFFDNVLYRASNGQITRIAERSPFEALPKAEYLSKVGDYYYAMLSEYAFMVYDLNLVYVTTLELPGYAGAVGYPTLVPLANGDIMYQYLVRLPDSSKDYDALVMEKGEAYPVNVVTEVMKIKNGKISSIDTDYYFAEADILSQSEAAEEGFMADTVYGYLYGLEIKDGMIDLDSDNNVHFFFLDEDGDLMELSEIEGERVIEIVLVADGRWAAYTAKDHKYLIDAQGNVLGEISNASTINGTYIKCNGKIYDMSLSMLLDYEAQDLDYYTYYGTTLVFTKGNETLTWNGFGTPTALVAANSENLSVYSTYDWGYVIRNSSNSTYTAYAWNGTSLFTVTATDAWSFYISTERTIESAYLITVHGVTEGTVYYRLAK